MTTTRCANCGCGIEDGAVQCAACGQVVVGASVGHMAARDFRMSPMPAPKYDLPFGAVESLSATFKLWTENMGRLFVLGLLPQLIMIPFVIVAIFAMVGIDELGNVDRLIEEQLGLLIGAGVGFIGLMTVLYTVVVSATFVLLNEKTQGVTVGPMGAIANGFRHAGWIFLAYTFLTAIGSVAAGAVIAPVVFGISEENPTFLVGAIPGGLVFAALAYVGLRLTPLLPAIVAEDMNIVDATARAWNLTRGRALELFAAWVLFIIVYFAIAFAVGMLAIIPSMIPVLGQLIQIAMNAFLTPLGLVFFFAVYAGLVRAQSQSAQA